MATSSTSDRALVRVSKISGRYLLFDIDDVMYLRRNHNICSPFVGSIPQNPQQNLFLGLPLELTPEEAQVLVDKKVARVVDDLTFHLSGLENMSSVTRQSHVQSLKNQGKSIYLAMLESRAKSAETKRATSKKKKKSDKSEASEDATAATPVQEAAEGGGGASLFETPTTPRKQSVKTSSDVEGYVLTPTTSDFLARRSLKPGNRKEPSVPVEVPASYPLFAHLHDRGYYMMPGIRFGCDYNVYPGDPLRFHSHFVAVHFRWDDEITMRDLISGGRLGTTVKKGYLFGGAVPGEYDTTPEEPQDAGNEEIDAPAKVLVAPLVRTFCLEWAGM